MIVSLFYKCKTYRRKFWFAAISILLIVLSTSPVHADDLIMVRSTQAFPEAMTNLQHAIINRGYQLIRVQRVDIGLTASGFKTDKYRLVFFGDKYMMEELPNKYPELIPYLPLKIVIYAEEDQTLILGMNPVNLEKYYPDNPELARAFNQWKKDLESILHEAQKDED
ncbi:MAG: DUF302 domain-containing protein [Gammaproteobacteria bacterium]|nr:DUF302 domain-containing protein [Gammaproteobacteria bacterium]